MDEAGVSPGFGGDANDFQPPRRNVVDGVPLQENGADSILDFDAAVVLLTHGAEAFPIDAEYVHAANHGVHAFLSLPDSGGRERDRDEALIGRFQV